MQWTHYRRVFGLLLLAVSLAALAWGLWPLPIQAHSLVISPSEMRPAELSPTPEPPVIADARILLLEQPAVMRVGDPASIRMMFAPSEQESSARPAPPTLVEVYAVLAEARLELPGVPYSPSGEISQALLPGRPVNFVWKLQPDRAGDGNGTVWLHLRFIPASGGNELRQVLAAEQIKIRQVDFLGLSGPWARALGSAGIVVGVALGLDGLVVWLWSRFQQKFQSEDHTASL